MSAIDWLAFISPYVWILLVLNGLALIPSEKDSKPKRIKLTLILCALALFGLLLAHIAIHVMNSPAIRINTVQASQVLLTPVLICLAAILIYRLYIGKNLLFFLLRMAGKALVRLLDLLAPLAPIFLSLITGAYQKYAEENPDDEERRKEQERLDDIHLNWRGEFSGENDINKY